MITSYCHWYIVGRRVQRWVIFTSRLILITHNFSINAASLLISIEGLLIFFVLVMRRKKVLKAISRTYGKRCAAIPEQWRTIVDSESDEDGDFNSSQVVEFSKRNRDSVDGKLTTKVDLTSGWRQAAAFKLYHMATCKTLQENNYNLRSTLL